MHMTSLDLESCEQGRESAYDIDCSPVDQEGIVFSSSGTSNRVSSTSPSSHFPTLSEGPGEGNTIPSWSTEKQSIS